MESTAMDRDPGTPGERQLAAFRLRQAAADPEALSAIRSEMGLEPQPAGDLPGDEGREDMPTPAVAEIAFEQAVLRERGRLAAFEQLVASDPVGVFTIRSKDLGVDLEYLKRIDSVDAPTGLTVIRFLLPRFTSVRIRPSDELTLECEGKEIPVTFIGDMHDFGGLLPVKMISFFGKGEV